MDTPVGTYDIMILQGATFHRDLTYKDSDGVAFDLTNYTALLQVREAQNNETVLLELSTSNGGIEVFPYAPNIVLNIEAGVTALMSPSFNGLYDLLIESAGGIADRILQGHVIVSPAVSREDGS